MSGIGRAHFYDANTGSWGPPGKVLSAWAEGAGAVLALTGLIVRWASAGRPAPRRAPPRAWRRPGTVRPADLATGSRAFYLRKTE
jgi:hypothetical protein